MTSYNFLPIILGSDENAYGTSRLFNEAFGIKPLLCCTRQLIPTSYSKLFTVKKIENFDSDSVFPGALLEVLKEYKKKYEKIIAIPCSDYYSALMSRHYDKFEGLIENKFITPELLNTLDTKDKVYALCESTEWTARCGENELLHLVVHLSCEALEDGRMLRIDRQDGCLVLHRPFID